MKRFFLCLVAACVTVFPTFSQDSIQTQSLDEVLVNATRAGRTTPVAQTNLTAKDLKQWTAANNLPHVLWMTPSLVVTSENGTGSGNASFRIRGTDVNRMNVTLNGIPLNNAESQEVYWVNTPDLTSALNSVQVQRGVGTSTNGPGAFGASVNMTTGSPATTPFVESATTVGSYGTFQQNIAFGTGVFGNGMSLDLRYSNLTTDGYIRNGWCDHTSLFASFVKRFTKSALKVNFLYGNQHTGITWEGISADQMASDPTFNPAGEITPGVYYDNESDNYRQHHLQAFYTQKVSENWLLNAGVNFTDGAGYYEQYKQDKEFSSMGKLDQTVDNTTYAVTDLIRRKNMANQLYTGNVNLEYQSERFHLNLGGMHTYYNGDHFATLLWVEHNENIPEGFEWVRNNGEKTDGHVFAKAEYSLFNGFNAYLDLQYRYVAHRLTGIDDDDMQDFTQSHNWGFFNPKTGLFYQWGSNSVFASVAVAHREPTRADLKDAYKYGATTSIKSEKLTDYEVGYTFDNNVLMFSTNIYLMNYKDQLVPTGKLNEVGYVLMSNVDQSYRAGLELALGWKLSKHWQVDANTTLSRNRVVDYTVWYDTYDNSTDWNSVTQQSQHFDEAKLPFSPEFMGGLALTWKPIEGLSLTAIQTCVGEQYISNTQNEALKLPAYQSTKATVAYSFRINGLADASLSLHVNNLTNQSYSSNGWGYESHFANGEPTQVGEGLYPVAPRNYLAKFAFKF